jgi:hypothetical protein
VGFIKSFLVLSGRNLQVVDSFPEATFSILEEDEDAIFVYILLRIQQIYFRLKNINVIKYLYIHEDGILI